MGEVGGGGGVGGVELLVVDSLLAALRCWEGGIKLTATHLQCSFSARAQ